MIRRSFMAVLLPLFLPSPAWADDQQLQQQIEEVRTQIEQEEAERNRLRQELEGMDEKVDNLKKQLKELEEKITKKQ